MSPVTKFVRWKVLVVSDFFNLYVDSLVHKAAVLIVGARIYGVGGNSWRKGFIDIEKFG